MALRDRRRGECYSLYPIGWFVPQLPHVRHLGTAVLGVEALGGRAYREVTETLGVMFLGVGFKFP